MSSQTIKTNNDLKAIENKILLRLNSLPDKDVVNVLECFGGDGILWDSVKKRTSKKIKIVSIDNVKYQRFQLQGDSLKVLKSINVHFFDIIDLDSYGIPYKHCKVVFDKKYNGVVHCTVIQSVMGRLPNGLLFDYGFTKSMISKCSTLFSRNGIDKFKNFIYKNGVKNIQIYSLGRKNYLWFKLVN